MDGADAVSESLPDDALTLRAFTVGSLGSTAILLRAGPDAVLVDPGAEAHRLLAALRDAAAPLREIWLTHAHFDHIGALQDVLDALPSPVPVRMHPGDRPLYDDAAAWAAWVGVPFRPPSAPTEDLADEQIVRVGAIRATCLHTPGHAPGHVSFHLPAAGTVLSGDALFRGSIGRTDIPYGDQAELVTSIRRRLLTLPDDTRVVPGHGAPTTIAEERRTNPFLNEPGPSGTTPSR